MTLYMKLGGRAAILRAMPGLAEKLEQDPYFDLGSLKEEMECSGDFSEFLIFLCGGAPFYDGKPFNELLSPFCNCNANYNRFVDHLVAVLSCSGLNADEEAELRRLMDQLRPQVLNPRPARPVLVYSLEPEAVRV